jgi:hypothetical protein
VVGGDRHGGAAAVGGDQPGDGLATDQRLVGQGHDDRADVRAAINEGLQAGAQRGAHAGAPRGVVDGARSGQLDGGGAHHDQDRVGSAGPQQVHAALGQGLPAELDQRLGLAEPGAFPRGEQDPRDRGAHEVQAYAAGQPLAAVTFPER